MAVEDLDPVHRNSGIRISILYGCTGRTDSSRLSELGIDIPGALVTKWWFGLRPWLKERRRVSREHPAFLLSRLGESQHLRGQSLIRYLASVPFLIACSGQEYLRVLSTCLGSLLHKVQYIPCVTVRTNLCQESFSNLQSGSDL